jgi:hypothetical protein
MSLPRYPTHVCLVSDQSLPNLLPILYEPFKPQRVILLVTPGMKDKVPRLERVIKDNSCKVEIRTIDAYAFGAVKNAVENLALEQIEAAFNLTGGTKVMALGAFAAARDLGLPVFYLDSREQRILLLHPEEQSFLLPHVLGVKTALRAQGFEIVQKGEKRVTPAHKVLTEELVQRVEELQKPLKTLNYLAAKAEKNLTVTIQKTVSKPLRDLLFLFQEAGLLDYLADGQNIIFRDEESRRYANGSWLEEHCLNVVLGLKRQKKVYDLEPNVVVQTPGGVKNELDLAFTAANRLHIIECKTAVLARDSDELPGETRAAEAGYKLDTLRDVAGGSFGKAMLVSYQPLREVDRIRCESYGIRVVQAGRLPLLRDSLLEWIR